VELQRKHYTRHGQHLNSSGKDLVSFELAKTIEQLLNKVKTAPTRIQWKDDKIDNFNLDIQSKEVNPEGPCNKEELLEFTKCEVNKTKSDYKIKVSMRHRKVPLTRSNDFFMVNKSNSIPVKNSVIKIFHQNIRGLRTKYNEILCNLQEHSPHFLCFTEHHL
jgi:hypothetical protein